MPAKELPSPTALSFIICDTVIEDKRTNKKTLVGLFNNINAKSFPCTHAAMHVFIGLTEGRGKYKCTLSCEKDDSSQKLFELPGSIEFKNPLAVVEINFEIRGVRFIEGGTYRFEFSCNNIPVISRKFQVL